MIEMPFSAGGDTLCRIRPGFVIVRQYLVDDLGLVGAGDDEQNMIGLLQDRIGDADTPAGEPVDINRRHQLCRLIQYRSIGKQRGDMTVAAESEQDKVKTERILRSGES